MGGCLGPKQRRQEVYIEMIETIHEEVTHMTFLQAQNIDIYQAMKEKLSKKGLLRKLIDNLVSHRNKIYDSLNHNYQIVMQNSRLQNKYAGLLIIDQIIQGIYQSLKATNKQIPYQTQSQDFTNMSTQQQQLNKHAPFPVIFQESVQQIFGDKQRKMSKLSAAMQGNPLIREIDSRFDLIYFNLIIYLLNDVPKMYQRILISINSFALNKKAKFFCTEAVWNVMNFIMTRKIDKSTNLNESVFTYRLLLKNTKQNFKEYQKETDLKTFIKLWISQQQQQLKQKQKNSPSLLPSASILQLQQSSEEPSSASTKQSEENVGLNLLKIISLYFHTNITTWNSLYLYEILIDLYDEFQFLYDRIGHFQTVIFMICDKNDLRVHFFRGLFIILLEYLCYRPGERGSRVQSGMHATGQDVKWPNSDKKAVKFNALKTLRRWVNNNHVDLNETVTYNCNLLFSAYLTNFHPLDPLISTQISKEFLKLVRQNLQAKSKQILILTIIEAIKQPETDPRIRTIIVNIMRELLQDNEVISQFTQSFDFIITIDEHYSKQNQLEIIQLIGFVIKALPDAYFKQENDPNATQILAFKHKICEFMYSCFEVIAYSSAEETFKYRFCCSVVSFLRAIEIKRNISFVYAFYLEIIKQMTSPTTSKITPNKNYFVLNLVYEVAHLLVEDVKLPMGFRIVNEKISTLATSISADKTGGSSRSIRSPAKDQLVSMIEKIITQEKYSDPLKIREEFSQNHIFQELRRRKAVNKENLESTCKILSGYFTNSCLRSKNLSTKDDNEESGGLDRLMMSAGKSVITGSFGRRDSIYHESENSSFYREEDRNLKDVLGIING